MEAAHHLKCVLNIRCRDRFSESTWWNPLGHDEKAYRITGRNTLVRSLVVLNLGIVQEATVGIFSKFAKAYRVYDSNAYREASGAEFLLRVGTWLAVVGCRVKKKTGVRFTEC